MKKFLFIIFLTHFAFAVINLPFPQAENVPYFGIKPNDKTQQELNSSVTNFYDHWIAQYLMESTTVPGDYKINYDTTAFISPTGIGAAVITNQQWLNNTFSYAAGSDEAYYEDSINLFSLITMSGNLWLWDAGDIPEPSSFYILVLGALFYNRNRKRSS